MKKHQADAPDYDHPFLVYLKCKFQYLLNTEVESEDGKYIDGKLVGKDSGKNEEKSVNY